MRITRGEAHAVSRNYVCYVCGGKGQHTTFLFRQLERDDETSLSHWMCGACLLKAITDGKLHLYTDDTPVKEVPELARPDDEEPEPEVEVVW